MLRIAICDDNKLHVARIKKLTEEILKEHKTEISEYSNANELLFKIEGTGYTPNIALLDIQMPDVDGISLAAELNHLAPECKIIFITSFIGYAPDVYSTEHVYYVLKSQLGSRLKNALEKAIESLNTPKSFLQIKSGSTIVRVPVENILYLERELHKTRIVATDSVYMTNQSPADLLSAVAENNSFIHCHQSYWVNLRAVSKMESNAFTFSDGTSIPISRAHKPEAKAAFFQLIVDEIK